MTVIQSLMYGGLAKEKGHFFKARSSIDRLVKAEGQFSKAGQA